MRYKEIYVMKIKVQRAYDAGPVSIVEPSCSCLANHGPFDVAQ